LNHLLKLLDLNLTKIIYFCRWWINWPLFTTWHFNYCWWTRIQPHAGWLGPTEAPWGATTDWSCRWTDD